MESSPKSSKSEINTFFGKCRCCLEYGYMKSMWSEYERDGLREIYGEMLMETFSVAWQSSDDSQDYICESCVSRLQDAYDFKKEMLASEQLMYEDLDELDQTSFKIESLDEYEDIVQENAMEDNLEIDKASASETEYYEVEYLEDEMDTNNEALDPTTGKLETLPVKNEKEKKWPRKKKRQVPSRSYKKYSEEDMKQCLEAVRENQMTVSSASLLYGVPRKSIFSRITYEQNRKKPDAPWVMKPCGTREQQMPAVKKHRANLKAVLENSNATPFKTQTGLFFTCNFCQKPYTQPKALKEHTLELHKDVTKAAKIKVSFGFSIKLDITGLKCKICSIKMELLEDLMTHLAYEHDVVIHTDITNQMVPYKFEDKEMKCAICSHIFTFFKLLAEHMSEHYRNFECELCGTPFINKQRYKMHKERHKTGVYFCSYCPKPFDNKMRRRDHERVVHINNNLTQKCSFCVEKFVKIEQKLEHERSVHGGTSRVLTCMECGEEFDNNKALTRHAKLLHPVVKPYGCSVCDIGFFKKDSLSKHLQKHASSEYVCIICDEQFPNKHATEEHMKYHKEEC